MNKKLFGLLAAASLGVSACAGEGGNREGNPETPVTAAEPVVTRSGAGYSNALENMANTYNQAQNASEAAERQNYFARHTLLVSDGKTVMTQPASMQERFSFTPKYLVEIRVNEVGGIRPYAEHSMSFCEVDRGEKNIEAAVDRMRSYASSEEAPRCGNDPLRTKLDLPDQFRAALMHVQTCLPAIASYASKSALPEALKTQCQDFATLRL